MTHASENLESAEGARYGAHAALSVSARKGSSIVAVPPMASMALTDTSAAANDDEAAAPDPVRNPLWVIATAMGCLFVVMAAVMSVG